MIVGVLIAFILMKLLILMLGDVYLMFSDGFVLVHFHSL